MASSSEESIRVMELVKPREDQKGGKQERRQTMTSRMMKMSTGTVTKTVTVGGRKMKRWRTSKKRRKETKWTTDVQKKAILKPTVRRNGHKQRT
eukprot:6448620-Amphidinium_carterae.1